jgi:hypothetical protein
MGELLRLARESFRLDRVRKAIGPHDNDHDIRPRHDASGIKNIRKIGNNIEREVVIAIKNLKLSRDCGIGYKKSIQIKITTGIVLRTKTIMKELRKQIMDP